MKHLINTIGLSIILVLLTLSYAYSQNSNVDAKEKKESNNSNVCEDKNKYEFTKTDNIVFFGDSITDYYPLAEIYGDTAPIINSGIAGYKTQDLLDKIDKMLYQYNPTKIFMLIGINDITRNTDEENIEYVKSNLEKLVKNIRTNRSKATLYVESIYPVNKKLREPFGAYPDDINERIIEVNKEIEKICKENGAIYINMHDSLTNSEGELREEFTGDGLHVNGVGYARITKELLPYLYE